MLGVRLGGACLFGRRPGVGFEQRRGGHVNLAVLPDHQHFFDSAITVLHLLCLLASWSGAGAEVAALIPFFRFSDSNFRSKKVAPAASDSLRRAARPPFSQHHVAVFLQILFTATTPDRLGQTQLRLPQRCLGYFQSLGSCQ